jgi:hypothetical protein
MIENDHRTFPPEHFPFAISLISRKRLLGDGKWKMISEDCRFVCVLFPLLIEFIRLEIELRIQWGTVDCGIKLV